MDEDTQVLTLADLIAFLRRYLIALVIAAVAAGGLAYVISRFLPRVYEARTIVLAAQTNPEFRQFGMGIATAAPLDVSVYRTATLSPDVLEDALDRARAAGLESTPELRDFRDVLTVTTESRGTSSLMTIAVRDEDPLVAMRLAEAVGAAAVAWDQRRARSAIDDLIESLTLQIQALDQQIRELQVAPNVSEDQIAGRVALRAEQQEQLYYARVLAGSASGLLSVLQRAELPDEPVAPRPVLNAALAMVLAVTLVLLVGLLRDLLDTRVRTIDQVTEITNLPLLAAFPSLPDGSRHAPREAANFLRANLAFALASAHPKVIVATSAGPSEGKTTLAVALATAFTRQDYRTLLVDLDLRKPMVGQALGISHSEVRIGRALTQSDEPLEVETLMLGEELPLDVIPAIAGLDHPGERISAGIGSLLARAQEHYDVIVFDTAPLMAVADALPVASIATATVLAVSLERSNRRQVANALDVLRRAGATVAGTVATHAPSGSRGAGAYGYGYGPAYGEPAAAKG
jgi:capsular exopolysaccharide synthesis family protein